MGGDGGVVATNRQYLRGAGTADKAGDYSRNKQELSKEADREYMKEQMKTCFLTKLPLDFSQKSANTYIVACAYGRLYNREAAIEALLRRKQQQNNNGNHDNNTNEDELGNHIRGMKDLYSVRFETNKQDGNNFVPICPVTGTQLNGQIPAYLIVDKKKKKDKKTKKKKKDADDGDDHVVTTNVLSERAIKEMGMDTLRSEYGLTSKEELIRLAPPLSMMETIKEQLFTKREKEQKDKQDKKFSSKSNSKKRHNSNVEEANNNGENLLLLPSSSSPKKMKSNNNKATNNNGNNSLSEVARSRVASAVKSNDVLSSLFTSSSKIVSDKEKKDNLFAR